MVHIMAQLEGLREEKEPQACKERYKRKGHLGMPKLADRVNDIKGAPNYPKGHYLNVFIPKCCIPIPIIPMSIIPICTLSQCILSQCVLQPNVNHLYGTLSQWDIEPMGALSQCIFCLCFFYPANYIPSLPSYPCIQHILTD